MHLLVPLGCLGGVSNCGEEKSNDPYILPKTGRKLSQKKMTVH